jgi:hypothetical protein
MGIADETKDPANRRGQREGGHEAGDPNPDGTGAPAVGLPTFSGQGWREHPADETEASIDGDLSTDGPPRGGGGRPQQPIPSATDETDGHAGVTPPDNSVPLVPDTSESVVEEAEHGAAAEEESETVADALRTSRAEQRARRRRV